MLAKSKQLKLLAFAASLLLALAAGEVLSRILLPSDFGQPRRSDERNTVYTHDSELGWYAVPNTTYTFERSRPITVRYNSLGLRDVEFDPNDERKRLLFLGDSYVWGFDVEARERFTDILRSSLPSWQIVNAGISGYGTDQEFLLLRRLAPIVKPDYVFVMFCKNDRDDNTHNIRRKGYYKPYFVLENGRLVKKGTPVPLSFNHSTHLGILAHSKLYLFLSFFGQDFEKDAITLPDPTHALLAEMRDYVTRDIGAEFSVGMSGRDEALLEWCRQAGIACEDLSTHMRYLGFGRHWTPEGHRWVADRLLEHFTDRLF